MISKNPRQTREPRGPSPSGGSSAANPLSLERPAPYRRGVGSRGPAPCRAAVALQPTGFPSCAPARIARSPGCRGTTPAASDGPVGSGF